MSKGKFTATAPHNRSGTAGRRGAALYRGRPTLRTRYKSSNTTTGWTGSTSRTFTGSEAALHHGRAHHPYLSKKIITGGKGSMDINWDHDSPNE